MIINIKLSKAFAIANGYPYTWLIVIGVIALGIKMANALELINVDPSSTCFHTFLILNLFVHIIDFDPYSLSYCGHLISFRIHEIRVFD